VSKSETARRGVAEAYLAPDLGERVPTTPALADRLGVSLGTVHAAITGLEQEGLIATTARGPKGRWLVERDVLGLWEASGRGAPTGVLPLPESREMAGLATALKAASERRGVTLQLLFRQGGLHRFETLDSGRVDFVVTSLSLALSRSDTTDCLPLRPHSYYETGALVVITPREGAHEPPRTVAADPASADNYAMTQREFPGVPIVEKSYMLIPAAVANHEVDAAVWHRTTPSPLMVAAGLAVRPLQQPAFSDLADVNRAALVWRKHDPAVGRVLRELFDPAELEPVQRDVLEGRAAPRF
jgi:hypothetical protein